MGDKKIFDKVMKAARDPKEHNPYHKANEDRDKKKEYNALTLPKQIKRDEE